MHDEDHGEPEHVIAFALLCAEAFDLNKEPRPMRDRYGVDPFGQGCLLARRLVENGVRYVEVKSKKNWAI